MNHRIAMNHRIVSEGGKQPQPWEKLRNQVYLGNDRFVEKAKKETPVTASREEIPTSQSKPRLKAKSIQTYFDQSKMRNEAIEAIFLIGGNTAMAFT